MRDGSNKKLIILSILLLLCVLVFYRVVKYYGNKEITPTVITINDDAVVADTGDNEDINVGDSGCTISGDYNGKSASPGSMFVFNVSSNCRSVSYNASNGSFARSGTILILRIGSACSNAKYSISADGQSISGTILVSSSWGSSTGCYIVSGVCESAFCANNSNKSVYYSGKGTSSCPNGYTIRYSRSCGGGGGGSSGGDGGSDEPPPPPPPACYGNEKYISIATDVAWLVYPDSAHPFEVSGVSSEGECVTHPLPSFCVPHNVSSGQTTKNTGICDENTPITTTDGISCSGNAFYNISCTNATNTKFDLDDDGDKTTTTKNLFVGEGFRYGITVTTNRSCTATFNASAWNSAYNQAQRVINIANSDLGRSPDSSSRDKIQSKIYEARNKQNDLRGMVSTYNNYNPNKIFNETSNIVLQYKVDNQGTTINTNLVSKTLQASVGRYTSRSTVSLGVSGVSNPSNYTWNNHSTPNIVKLNLPKQYIDYETGMKASSDKKTGYIDGGNKIYIDYYTTPGTYPLDIKISGIGGNGKINNNKCSIKVSQQEILYRPIDVSNPFINNEWKPGKNWINSKFDFRNVIHANIWG